MKELFFILAKTISILLSVLSFAMLLRMIIPWFKDPMDSKLYAIVCYVSEPFIIPVRAAMVKLNIGQDSPIDWAFSITYLIIILLKNLLPAI